MVHLSTWLCYAENIKVMKMNNNEQTYCHKNTGNKKGTEKNTSCLYR